MAPTILVVGATGNTGRKVAETLPSLLKNSESLSSHRILCLSRSAQSVVAKDLAKISGIELVEQNWVNITADWLREHNVERVFLASHNFPNQFAEESQFYVSCLRAGVKYVVRISTTSNAVQPYSLAYYQRAHWAIESMLSSPAYEKLGWTSLQPHIFLTMALAPAAEFIKKFRENGKQDKLSLFIDEKMPAGLIDPNDVGRVAAHLIAADDISPYDHKKLVLNGPEEINGAGVVKLVEQYIGTKVEDVVWGDTTLIEQMAEKSPENKNIILYMADASKEYWASGIKDAPTSKEVLELCPPRSSAAEVLEELLK
ncbi:NAD(P)-binding protein [Aureobasidium sp. EXF-10728]|nr:NAD(P)-binding protein [Aureobasidium sp. EXF-10728]